MSDATSRFELPLAEMKVVYRALHAHLAEHLELMESDFLGALQRELQARAKADGVDATDHAAWDAWLGNVDAASCEERVQARRVLS
ncbi:MAG: hypothetical protein WKG00_38925 [Polyangiaceae bacterium]